MSSEVSARHAFPFLAAGQAQKELTHNEALALIDAGLSASVMSAGSDTPPVSPTSGQCWILGTTPGGVWAGHANALACWTDNGWRFLPPVEGARAWVLDQQLWAEYVGGEWSVGAVVAGWIKIGEDQVVGPRQANVAMPAGGTTIDVEARTAIGAILGRLEAHGLIAP